MREERADEKGMGFGKRTRACADGEEGIIEISA